MKKLSVIIPCYNSERTIEYCVKSVLDSSYVDLEIIIVNDGSTDHTKEIADDLANSNSKIRAFYKSNEGLGCTRNYGILKATGDYITFIDSDDYIDKNAYEKMINKMERDNSDVVFCGFNYVYEDGIRTDKFDCNEHYRDQLDFIKYILSIDHCYAGVSACTGIYKRDILLSNSIVFSPEQHYLSEDKLFNINYLRCCNGISVLSEPLYYYVQHTEGTITTSFKTYKIDAAYNLFDYLFNTFDDNQIRELILSDYLVNLSACCQQLYNDDSIPRKEKIESLRIITSGKYVTPLKLLNQKILKPKFRVFLHLVLFNRIKLLDCMFRINTIKKKKISHK